MKLKWSKRAMAVTVSLAVFVVSAIAQHSCSTGLSSQNAADRWSTERRFSQISCFFSKEAGFTRNNAKAMQFKLQEALESAGTDGLVECYSSETTMELRSDREKGTFRCIAVGGDFFTLHPMQLLTGCYFDEDDLNNDGVILDETVAWQLYGSSNIVGMTIQVGDYVYPIRGVVKAEQGMFQKASQADVATAYIAYPLLDSDVQAPLPVTTYEALLPSPVDGFGMATVTAAMEEYKNSCEIIENTSRFSIVNRLAVLKSFGARSMQNNGINYPYWENQARGYEDVVAFWFLLSMISLIYPVIEMVYMLFHFRQRRRLRKAAKK